MCTETDLVDDVVLKPSSYPQYMLHTMNQDSLPCAVLALVSRSISTAMHIKKWMHRQLQWIEISIGA